MIFDEYESIQKEIDEFGNVFYVSTSKLCKNIKGHGNTEDEAIKDMVLKVYQEGERNERRKDCKR